MTVYDTTNNQDSSIARITLFKKLSDFIDFFDDRNKIAPRWPTIGISSLRRWNFPRRVSPITCLTLKTTRIVWHAEKFNGTISRGDVVLCDLNPVVSTEQAGVRPAVVLQIDRANAVSPHTIIAPFTTKIRRALLPSHVLVPAGAGGLTQDSVVLCEQIRVIDKRRIIRVLGRLDDSHMQNIAKALSTILGL